ncbi:MAG: hypothetical protein DELT_01780 [Desulfovibrio sp.]
MLRKSRNALEKILRNRGFTSPDSRRIMANQLLVTFTALTIGVLAIPFSLWPLAFGLGAALATLNLWRLVKSVHWSVSQHFSPAIAVVYFGGFLLRFAGTGALLYLFLVPLALPLVPLLVGLSSVMVVLISMNVSRSAGNSCKEA